MENSNGTRTTDTKTLRRAVVLGFVMIFLAACLLLTILKLQTVDYEKYQNKVINQLTTESEVLAERGKIYDRNGVLLATNITTYRLFISPRTIQSQSQEDAKQYDVIIATGLSSIVDSVSYENVLKQTTYTKYLDRTVARNLKEDVAEEIRVFIDENNLQDMVFLQAGATRYYPQGTLACHILGFTGADGSGQYGIELQYNSVLSGTNGKYITARDSHGNEMPDEYQSYIEAQNGSSLTTTIDIYVQSALEEQLKTTYIESGGKERASGMVMDVNTGEILAMATYPDFDLNDPRKLNGDSERILSDSGYLEDSDEYLALKQELQLLTWSNKAVTEIYMPGSTFKIITAAMAYEENLVKENEHFSCPGYHVVAGRKIRCHKVEGHGSLTFAEGIQQSCNPVLMMMGGRIGQEKFYNYFKSFGYLEKTGIDLPGEGVSIFYQPDKFSVLDLATSAFGQNFKISPLQQLSAVSAVANGGFLVTPHLVKEVIDEQGNVTQSYGAKIKRQVVSGETCKTIAEILEDGVSGTGGAKNAYVAGYRVAAKTGTSEKIGDDETLRIGSCAAFAPAEDPEIAIIIIVDEPTCTNVFGSYVAAPYVANCLEQMLPALGVEAVYTSTESAKLEVEVGNYMGMMSFTAREAIRKNGLEVEIIGNGEKVTAQVPAAGSKLSKQNGKIVLYVGDAAPSTDISVPNVIGMSASVVNKVLINAGFNISIEGTTNYEVGSGAVVVSQYPEAGTPATRGDVITVTFRHTDVSD